MTNFITARRTPRLCSLTLVALGILAAIAITGCGDPGLSGKPTQSQPVSPANTISGRVMGGQQPVTASTIQLYAVNTTAFRGASSSVLTGSVVTDSSGNFSLVNKINCPVGALVYIVATGGNAGGGTNGNISLMAGLGLCSNINSSTYIIINEVTTVASVYALGPFMADYADIGAASTNFSALTNAFTTINSLVNTATGNSPGLGAPANALIPTTQLNTIADIIAACINSMPAAGTSCSTLFGLALPAGGSPAPTETIGAVLNIARNPGANVAQIYTLLPTTPPFQPNFTSAPDFTVAIKLTGNNLTSPYGVAIDASGNAWVTNEAGGSVSEFSPTGAPLAGSGSNYTFSGAQGLTIDPSGNVWVANTGGNNVIKLTSAGALSKTVTNAFLNAPVDIAADARGNIWVANFLPISGVYYVSEFTNTGTFQNGLANNVSAPNALAVDPSGNVWISNNLSGYIAEYNKTFTQVSTGSGFTDNALQGPSGIATDASGNAWVVGQGGPELSGFTSAGTPVTASPIYAALMQPTGIAVDSNGAIWVTNSTTSGYLSEFTAGTGVAVTSEQALGSLNSPVQVAVDPSGNLWTANSGDNSVTVFIGLAAPTTTPLVARTQ